MQSNIIKLTNTVYELLEYFPESDPLKNKAKEKALEIMSRVAGENPMQKDIDALLGYLEIGKMRGWLNPVNFIIISNEYKKIGKSTQSRPVSVLNNTELKAPNFSISGRQRKIIEFLEKNEKAQVMDLMSVLPNITKRTIRRDLDELMKNGNIVRGGEFNQVFYEIAR
jgi:hypothetical protein